MADPAATERTLDRLHALAITLAIDDFGVGHSSLGQLARAMPISILKLDRSFVAGMDGSRDRSIVEAAASLARALGLSSVAEGGSSRTHRPARWRNGVLPRPGLPLRAPRRRRGHGAAAERDHGRRRRPSLRCSRAAVRGWSATRSSSRRIVPRPPRAVGRRWRGSRGRPACRAQVEHASRISRYFASRAASSARWRGSSAAARRRRTGGASASRPPTSATRPPSQIQVTSGETMKRNCAAGCLAIVARDEPRSRRALRRSASAREALVGASR